MYFKYFSINSNTFCDFHDIYIRIVSGVPAFKDMELDFIDEYVEVLAPISVALDKLQGQSNESMAFMGTIMPMRTLTNCVL
jgi:hypothetical protein